MSSPEPAECKQLTFGDGDGVATVDAGADEAMPAVVSATEADSLDQVTTVTNLIYTLRIPQMTQPTPPT